MAPRRVVLFVREVDGAQNVVERRARKGHRLDREVVERAIRLYQQKPRLVEERRFLDPDRRLAAGFRDVEIPIRARRSAGGHRRSSGRARLRRPWPARGAHHRRTLPRARRRGRRRHREAPPGPSAACGRSGSAVRGRTPASCRRVRDPLTDGSGPRQSAEDQARGFAVGGSGACLSPSVVAASADR